ncbi:DNA mismatch repair endonuclease MutL [Halalkalibacterium ligniniphilum]|uniref:DNA mismatch repair endonuclease MutL n=1 Tax=Halalkalibacterium ligniniphilum TaxID=1134413 RepID=UPI000346238D|nr:DNA mismatch repair endonuclease MutL [Halalkalibacterium ligniniphilum]
MGKIIKLDEQLSNKIAAGEVVERPASIVKELVENALDANSKSILVEVEAGGLDRIRVVDDGDGIEKDDVEAAFYRHATSKIKNDKDLFQIMTLGFRGEALPSIASVSHLILKTSTGVEAGIELTLEGGKIIESSATKTRKGTDVTVTNLFYNTPARLKYLKTVHTEIGNISDVINRLAIAYPHVSFQLVHNGKEMLKTSGNGDRLQVIAAIYGRSVAKSMLSLKGETIDFQVTGYVAKPEITRASRQYLSIFVNGRYIRNYALARAIQEGYHTLLPIGRYPIAVLHIQMDPLLIDVNVHPSKLEVRLSKEDELCRLITESIKECFQRVQLIPEAARPKQPKQKSEQLSLDLDEKKPQELTQNLVKEVTTNEQLVETTLLKAERIEQPTYKITNEPIEANQMNDAEETESESDSATEVFIDDEVAESTESSFEATEKMKKEAPVLNRVPTMYPIGQMHGTYILAQNELGLYIIDQHAAQERIKYEFFRDKVGQVKKELQELLVPFTIECTHQEAAILEENMDKLKEVGVFLEEFGAQTYIVRSHPTWLPKGLEEETIREIVDQLLEEKKIDVKKLREKAAILMSCKAAIKANRHLRQDEMFALLDALRKSSDPFTCPHGRPIIVQITTYEMEKMFKRVM